jgi:cytochrome c553
MKRIISILTTLGCTVFIFQCAPKKIEYNLPEPMSAETRSIYMERLEKGKTLYKLNCSACHGIFSKGKDSIPNFTKDQINNYRSAVLMAKDKKNHAVAANMSPQQLDYIIMFLSFRKHDN